MVVNATGVVVDADLAAAEVDGRGADLQDLGRRRPFGAPQHRLDARDELGRRERFGHVVVGAELEPEHAVDLAVAGGEEDHGDRRRLPKPAAHLEAVDVGEPDVEHDEARPVLADRLDAVLAGGGLHDPEALAAEVELDQVGDVGLVVDDENGAALHRPSIVASDRRMNVSFVLRNLSGVERSGSRLARARAPSQAALGLGVRTKVSRSTATSPKRGL